MAGRFLLVALQLRRPGDPEDSYVLLAVGQDGFAHLPARPRHNVFLHACWEKGLAQEVVDVGRALEAHQRHERLQGKRKKKAGLDAEGTF